MAQENYGSTLKKIAKKNNTKEKWLRTRMWFSTFISTLYNDRGVIPPNIGNNILVSNNVYVTKNSINAVILVKEFSEDTPEAFTSAMLEEVKDKVENIIIDITFKNKRHNIDTSASGLKSRMTTWENTLNNPYTSEYLARRAARCIYTVDVAKSGEKLYKSHVYITVRGETGKELQKGIEEVCAYLSDIGASYYVVKSDMETHLEYLAMMSDKANPKMKDVPYNVMSQTTLTESLPVTQGLNDIDGTLMGMDMHGMSPYFINFRLSANAKNIYLVARSGFGKTFLVINWLIDMYADDYNLCIMDIKGTEFTEFTKSCNGIIISMRSDSTSYVNSFRWRGQEVKNKEYRVYAERMLRVSKEKMSIICNLTLDLQSRGEALIEEFLLSLYTSIGVLVDNPNTWERTESLNPYTVYEAFDKYLSNEILDKYIDVASKMLGRLSIYWSRKGSNSHMFRDAYSYDDILQTKVLTFDFGIIDNASKPDPVTFKLKVTDMEFLNDEFVSYKKSLGQWTGKVLEESQIVENYIMEIYTREITLGRARNQVNMLLGNSISSLESNPKAQAALENINIFVLGVLHKTSRNYIVKEFGLTEKDEDDLAEIATNPEYENTFLLINKMQKSATKPLIHAYVPDRVRDGKLFKVVDTEDVE